MSATTEVVLPLGSMVPIAPGIHVTLKKVNTPGTGAHTAVVSVRQGTAAPTGAVEAKLDELARVVHELKANQAQPQQPATVPGLDSLVTSVNDLHAQVGQLTGKLQDVDDEQAKQIAGLIVEKMGHLEDMGDKIEQIAEGVRLLMDE